MSQQPPAHQSALSTLTLTSGKTFHLAQTAEEVVEAIQDERRTNAAAGFVWVTLDTGTTLLLNPQHILSIENGAATPTQFQRIASRLGGPGAT